MNSNHENRTVFSGIQPTGVPTLGNYLGALKNWNEMQQSYNCIYCVVDLHAITVRQDPAELHQNSLNACALLLACGLDPARTTLFLQSHVHSHPTLAWVLSCFTQFGELGRMTQFKDKSQKNADNINAGLFTYPVLMASDILLYDTKYVPVGQDQKQHLEIARTIAERFNGVYSATFTVPEPYIPKEGAKIMSLAEPSKKMSKSDGNANAFVTILDSKDTIIKKFKRAVTDSEAVVRYAEGKDGINNLMTIYSVITKTTYADIEAAFRGQGYGAFKEAVGEAVAAELQPVRERFNELIADTEELLKIYRLGAEKAAAIAARKTREVYEKVGFVL